MQRQAAVMLASAAGNWHLAGEFPSVWCETTVVLVAYFVLEAQVNAAAERFWRSCARLFSLNRS